MNQAPITILQVGTSRFLQAHVDLFLDQAQKQGQDVGSVAILQTSDREDGKRRVHAFNQRPSFPVVIQGIEHGKTVDVTYDVAIVAQGLAASDPDDWQQTLALMRQQIRYIVSNTADKGYETFPDDPLTATAPRSFPAKLTALLLERFQHSGDPLTILPCELIPNNAHLLKRLVLQIATDWQLPSDFSDWLDAKVVWANTLVDRIVSQAIEPIGAVAEPYALWAIEQTPGLKPPCEHPAIELVPSLDVFERLKLGVLNLSHTFLVEKWLREDRPAAIVTVLDAVNDPGYAAALADVLQTEVTPVLERQLPGVAVAEYAATVRERFRNPFLKHRLDAIADNHDEKLKRRVLPAWEASRQFFPDRPTPALDLALRRNAVSHVD